MVSVNSALDNPILGIISRSLVGVRSSKQSGISGKFRLLAKHIFGVLFLAIAFLHVVQNL